MRLTIFLLIGLAAVISADKVRYDYYEVHRLVPKTEEQLHALREFQRTHKFDFWLEPRNINLPVSVLVPSDKKPIFEKFLELFGIDDQIQIDNIQRLIDEEEKLLASRSTKELEWTDYHQLPEIYDWLVGLEAKYDNVKVIVGGNSYEGRNIKGIEINNGDDLPGVVIESGIHAREWINPAATSWIINEILQNTSDPIWRQFNWLYFPSVNPDGYAYTWDSDRLWRKTRKPRTLPSKIGPGETCYGVDANRNFDTHWMEIGADLDPCSETYAGPKPFSELETKTLSDYLIKASEERNNRIYVTFHSFGQLLMFPWGYTDEPEPSYDLWQRIGEAAAASLREVHGTEFQVGQIFDTMYPTSGSSVEWYYDKLNATLSYTFEVRDTGEYGFLLPPEQIIPVAEECLASLKTILVEYQKI